MAEPSAYGASSHDPGLRDPGSDGGRAGAPVGGSVRRTSGALPPLEVLKALGDDTRYAIFVQVTRSSRPMSTAELASALGLHVNTVRPHLERMREVGLLEVRHDARGDVGRPQHVYFVSPDAPSPGSGPSSLPLPHLAEALLDTAVEAGLDVDGLVEIGRARGVTEAAAADGVDDWLGALVESQARQGFDPAVIIDDETTAVVKFERCAYSGLDAERLPLVCGLHRGEVSGFVTGCDRWRAVHFGSAGDRDPCQVELTS